MDYSGKSVFKDINLKKSNDIMSVFDKLMDNTNNMLSDMEELEYSGLRKGHLNKKDKKPKSKPDLSIPFSQRYEDNLVNEINRLFEGNTRSSNDNVGMTGFPIFDFAHYKKPSAMQMRPIEERNFEDVLNEEIGNNEDYSSRVDYLSRGLMPKKRGASQKNISRGFGGFNKGNFNRNNKFKNNHNNNIMNFNKKYNNNKFIIGKFK